MAVPGWTELTESQQESLGLTKEPGEIQAKLSLNAFKEGVNKKSNVNVFANTLTGKISTYEAPTGALTGAGTEIFSLDPATNQEKVAHTPTFNAFFTGRNSRQLANTEKITKQAVLSFAKDNINLNIPGSRETYNNIANSKGYKSLANSMFQLDPDENNEDLQFDFNQGLNVALPNQQAEKDSFAVAGSKDVLRYPEQSLESFGYDYIQIKAFEYVPGGLDMRGKKSGFGSGGRFKDSYETIQLPMQPAVETTSTQWQSDNLNFVKAAGARAAEGIIGGAGGLDMDELGKAAGQGLDDMKAMATDPAVGRYVKAYFAGQAVGANVLGRTTGQVVNPNMELLFSGPNLRNFNFNFNLTPRDDSEASICRKIIRAMKRNMTPQRSGTGMFLETPRIFEIKYIYGGEGTFFTNKQHPFMNEFKPCACVNFSVNYVPDGSYMTYSGGSLTSYQINMGFGEIEPIYADEYKENAQSMGF